MNATSTDKTAVKTKGEPTQPKVKKEPVLPATRIQEQLKRAAITGKISKDELTKIGELTTALQTFIS